jgi:hypothetical protein
VPRRARRYCGPQCYNAARAEAAECRRLDRTGRAIAARLYPLDGVTCEHPGCEADAVERHHIDGDTWHNARDNIALLCRFHHMEADGRLRGIKTAKLSADDVGVIRASSESGRALAARFGVSEAAISMARNGRTWKAAA